jgi:hypothetical protein
MSLQFLHLTVSTSIHGEPKTLCGYKFLRMDEEGYFTNEDNASAHMNLWGLSQEDGLWKSYQRCEACERHPDLPLQLLGDIP